SSIPTVDNGQCTQFWSDGKFQLMKRSRMSNVKIRRGNWVVVCDGAKALVLENVGNANVPNLMTKEVYEQEDPKTHELGTDAPGRAFNSVGEIRSAMEQTDLHDQAERGFLEELAG